jgi:predicted deacylase
MGIRITIIRFSILVIAITLLPLSSFSLTPDNRYHYYDEIKQDFQELANTYSDMAEFSTIGKTYEGRDIFALKITKGNGVKPKVLFQGGIHAREWLSPETMRLTAKSLLEDYSKDGYVKYLVDNAEIWIVPIVNPDGYEYDRKTSAMWRKNRRPVDANNDGTIDAIGVDLNRNYDYAWDPPLTASTNPNSEVYRGPNPASESEIQTMQKLLSQNFRTFVDYHSFGEMLMYPWGCKSSPSANDKTFRKIGNKMAEKIRSVNGRSYRVGAIHSNPYPVSGSSDDYAYGKYKINAYGIELPGGGFHPPSSYIIPVFKENYEAIKCLIDWAIGPPYLKKVLITQDKNGDGNFNNVIYDAEWISDGNGRKLKVNDASPAIGGKLKIKLIFNKPMNTSKDPVVSFGFDSPYDKHKVSKAGGWMKTNYQADTWEGEIEIASDKDIEFNGENVLSVKAQDSSNQIDANPATIPTYADKWENCEQGNDTSNKFEIFISTLW